MKVKEIGLRCRHSVAFFFAFYEIRYTLNNRLTTLQLKNRKKG